tara:strand:- start:631 stop:1170 length:540 start_codon:yes stop_codon:yes gene_type:complete
MIKRFCLALFNNLGCISLVLLITSCLPNEYRINKQPLGADQISPSISGNGRKLVFLIESNGYKRIQLEDISSRRIIPLRYLSRYRIVGTPAISWNGRYIAASVKIGSNIIVMIEDLIAGKLYRFSLLGGSLPTYLSLSPDASKLVVYLNMNDKRIFEFFDLTKKLEPDLPKRLGNQFSI